MTIYEFILEYVFNGSASGYEDFIYLFSLVLLLCVSIIAVKGFINILKLFIK